MIYVYSKRILFNFIINKYPKMGISYEKNQIVFAPNIIVPFSDKIKPEHQK